MSTEPESKRDANTRERLKEIASMVNEQLPDKWGFILLTFPFNDEPGRLNYIANCVREDAVKVLREWLAKVDQKTFGKHQ